MPAWFVTKLWTDAEIGKYRQYVASEGPKKARNGTRCSCEDLALRMVIEFTSSNGLPFHFANGKHDYPDGITPAEYPNLDDFMDEVLMSTGARDFEDYSQVKPIQGAMNSESTSLRLASPGDLILLEDDPRSPGVIHHVQVVTSKGSSEVKISQGNHRHGSNDPCLQAVYDNGNINQNDPRSACYYGEIVAEKKYVLDPNSGKWLYGNQGEVFKDQKGRLRMWSFDGWNSRMIPYIVKQGDDFYSIATNAYGKGFSKFQLSLVMQCAANLIAIQGGLRPASVLYLWR